MAKATIVIPDQVNVITLECAQSWHKAFKDQNNKGFRKGDLPMSIVIPFADIEQIVNDVKQYVKKNVNGVRLYLIIKPKQQKGRPRISGILVPTTGPMLPNKNGIYNDLIVKTTLKKGAPKNIDCEAMSAKSAVMAKSDSGDEYDSIYDVTRPCPPYCNPESPING